MVQQVLYTLGLKDVNFNSGLRTADSGVRKLESSLHGAKNAAMSLGSAFGLSLGLAGVGLFVRNMVKAGTTVENARTGLTTLLRDANEASQVIKNTMEDATRTPFAFEGLLSANKALISAGIESKRAREDVLNLANAIAATGGGDDELMRMVVNLQQISNTGKATALDIKQFAFAGVNIYKVLEAAGIKAKKEGEETVITYEQITSALKKAHEAGGIYAGGLEAMAGNTSVQISNLGDAFYQLSVKIFDDLKPAIESIIRAAFSLVERLRKLWDWAVKNKEIIKSFSLALVSAWASFKLFSGASAILGAIAAASVPAAAGLTSVGTAATFALGPIGLLAAAVGGLTLAYNLLGDAKNRTKDYDASMIAMAAKDTDDYLQKMTEVYSKPNKAGKSLSREDAFALAKQKYSNEIEKGALEQYNKAIAAKAGSDEEKIAQARLNYFNDAREALSKAVMPKAQGPRPLKGSDSSELKKVKAEKTKATGAKSVTINVDIRELIGIKEFNTTNIKEGVNRIKEAVVQVMTGAVNDFQIVASGT